MLLSQRIAGLQRLEVRLRRLAREDAVFSANISLQPRKDTDRTAVVKRAAEREKLLFRKVPIVLSLLERSFFFLVRREKSCGNAAAQIKGNFLAKEGLTGGTQLEGKISVIDNELWRPVNGESNLLPNGTHTLPSTLSPQQRIIRRPACMSRLFCALHLVEQERRRLYSYRMDKLQCKLREAENMVLAARRRRDDVAALTNARHVVSEAKEDIRLFQGSLLSRPYVSARLWRFLLREEIWIAAVHDSRQVNDDSPVAPSVIAMLLSLTRLGFGALRDVVKGHSLNTRAPRFVASLPSIKLRQRIRKKKKPFTATSNEKDKISSCSAAGLATDKVDNEDPTMLMMMMMMAPSVELQEEHRSSKSLPFPQTTATEKKTLKKCSAADEEKEVNVVQLRWLPPSSCDVVPLVLETLAMCSHVLPAVEVTGVVTRCGLAQEFFELLSVLQATASVLLAIGPCEGSVETVKHQTLRRLEDAMLNCGESAKRALVSQVSDVFLSFSSIKAARLLLGLESMKLLCANEHASYLLIMQLVMRIFPQLSTGTQRALLEKSRQNNLFAFATKGKRIKLRREHGKHGVEAALLSSVKARARLQQRQMQAALRANYLEEVNQSIAGELAENLSIYSLNTLFGLLVRAARDFTRQGPDAQSRLITAALFVADGVFLAASRTSSCEDFMFQTSDLLTLLMSLSVLWPLVTARYQMMRQSFADQEGNNVNYKQHTFKKNKKNSVGESMAKSELLMVSQIKDMVFAAVNAALAERVQEVECTLEPRTEVNCAHGVRAKEVEGIVNALFEWCNLSLSNRDVAFLETSARLLKRLLVADVQLWQELRLLSGWRREQFVRTLSELFRRLDMMDASVSQALSAVW